MIRHFSPLTALAVVLGGCAPAKPPPRLAPPPPVSTVAPSKVIDVIAFRRLSWGATVHFWRVSGSGEVMWEEPESDLSVPRPEGAPPVMIAMKRFQLGNSDRAALASLLPRAEKGQQLPDECSNYIPDGPYGLFEWSYAGQPEEQLKVTASCLEGPNADKAEVAFAADHIVSDAAKGQPVVSRRPAD